MSANPNDPTDQSAYSVTLKGGNDFKDPWLVIRADTIEHLHDRVKSAASSGIMATIGNTAKDFQAAYRLGTGLGAEPINPPREPAKAEKNETPQGTEEKVPAKKAPVKRKTPTQKKAEAEAAEAAEKPAEAEKAEEAPKKAAEPEKAAEAPKERPVARWRR